jgi:hypothetical protein
MLASITLPKVHAHGENSLISFLGFFTERVSSIAEEDCLFMHLVACHRD